MKAIEMNEMVKQKIIGLKNNPIILIIIISLILFILFRNNIKAWLAKGEAFETIIQKDDNVIKVQNEGQNLTINLKNVADGIYDAFYGSRLTEDEEKAIALLKTVPPQYIKQVAYLYAQKGKDMYADFRKYLRKNQYAKVSSLLE